MPKESKKEKQHLPPIRLGDKFLCPHCRAEVPVKQDCPVCRLDIDWTKI